METVVIKDAKIVDVKKDLTGLWYSTATDNKKWLPLNKFSKHINTMTSLLQELQKGQIVSLVVNAKGFIDEIILSGIDVKTEKEQAQEEEPRQVIEDNTPMYSSFDSTPYSEPLLGEVPKINIPGIEEMMNYPMKMQKETLNIDKMQTQQTEVYLYNNNINDTLQSYAAIVSKPDIQVKIMDSCINRAIKIITTSDISSDMPSSYMSFVISKYALKTVDEVKAKILEEIKSLAKKLFEFQTQEVINYLKQFEQGEQKANK